MDDKLDDDSFFDQLKALNLKPIEKSRPDTQSAFDESRRDVVKFNMTIKATYHQNFVFHNANLCQIAHHQPNLLDHLPSLRMHTQYQPVRSTLLLNLHSTIWNAKREGWGASDSPAHRPLCVPPQPLFVPHRPVPEDAFAVLPGGTGTRISRPPAHEGLRQIDLSQSLFTTRNGTYFAPDAIWKDGVSDAKTLALSTLTDLISIIPSAKPTPTPRQLLARHTLLFPNNQAHEMVRFFPAVADTLLLPICEHSGESVPN
ncbi:hypothetical protein BLNAU_4137 [Blattamonas nauphoetae]|uniref:Uncharacterized protein n=1 Tax=Blattamonas nauphoetae TaxID=2049346 RepID=A0ABQ9YAP0_9EUKA|nr:hypothetical protein BLNAU_4137 [Blattamonas nauphoetae]